MHHQVGCYYSPSDWIFSDWWITSLQAGGRLTWQNLYLPQQRNKGSGIWCPQVPHIRSKSLVRQAQPMVGGWHSIRVGWSCHRKHRRRHPPVQRIVNGSDRRCCERSTGLERKEPGALGSRVLMRSCWCQRRAAFSTAHKLWVGREGHHRIRSSGRPGSVGLYLSGRRRQYLVWGRCPDYSRRSYGDIRVGGDMRVTGGAGSSSSQGQGGHLVLAGGAGAGGTGGFVSLSSGSGTATSSGSIVIRSVDAGTNGVSGSAAITTGSSKAGATGRMVVSTGATSNSVGRGGNVNVRGGEGRSGRGGDVISSGGASSDVTGSISIDTGAGMTKSSGSLIVRSRNAGTAGASGELSFSTGTTSSGGSGSVIIATGNTNSGESGHARVGGGTSVSSEGGAITLDAGSTDGSTTGGSASLASGAGTARSSGAVLQCVSRIEGRERSSGFPHWDRYFGQLWRHNRRFGQCRCW